MNANSPKPSALSTVLFAVVALPFGLLISGVLADAWLPRISDPMSDFSPSSFPRDSVVNRIAFVGAVFAALLAVAAWCSPIEQRFRYVYFTGLALLILTGLYTSTQIANRDAIWMTEAFVLSPVPRFVFLMTSLATTLMLTALQIEPAARAGQTSAARRSSSPIPPEARIAGRSMD